MTAASAPSRERAAPRGLAARAVEYFTLREAASALAKLPEGARVEVGDTVELSRQRATAAEALFSVGHTVEALRLAQESLTLIEAAADRYARALGVVVDRPAEPVAADPEPADASADVEPSAEADAAPEEPTSKAPAEPRAASPVAWKRLADRAQVSPARVTIAERAIAHAATLTVPKLEKDIAPAHVEAFRDLLRARAVIDDTVAPATHTSGTLMGARVWRTLTASVLGLVVIVGLVMLLRPVEGTFVRASATWADSPDFRPDFIIDGDESTMWLLPDSSGWVDVRVAPAIPEIHRITLMNAGNSRVTDRGTHEYRIELFVDGEMAQQIDGAFSEDLGATATHEVTLRNVERIRFTARNSYRMGAGLSELRWE